MSTLYKFRRALVGFVALGVLVVAGLGLFADAPKMLGALGAFRWEFLPLVLVLTVFNYVLRFLKWQYYLRCIGVSGLSLRRSLLIFLSGFAMVVTPGKVGEWLKSYLLREATGTPMSVSAPIVIAERLTDGLAMVLLASAGIVVYGYGGQLLLAIFVFTVALVALSQQRALATRVLGLVGRMPFLGRSGLGLAAFYESSHELLKTKNLLVAVGIGTVSWWGECVAFFLVLMGLGIEGTPTLLLQATFILCAATLLGNVTMLPGGLGVEEGSIAGMLLLLGATDSLPVAAAATLIIRFCTLWFGVSLGAITLLTSSRGLLAQDSAESPTE